MAHQAKSFYLLHSNFHTCLGSNLVIGSYLGKVIIGDTEVDDNNQCRFQPKSLTVPADKLFNFVNVIKKAQNALQTESEEPFEDSVWVVSNRYALVGNYGQYEGDWRFSLRMKWHHKKDSKFLQKVACGLAEPILDKPDWIYLQRGFVLSKEQVDNIHGMMPTILSHAFFDSATTQQQIHELVDFAVGKEDLWSYVTENLKIYPSMSHIARMEILRTLIVAKMTSDGLTSDDFKVKTMVDSLSNKMILIFCLLNNRAN